LVFATSGTAVVVCPSAVVCVVMSAMVVSLGQGLKTCDAANSALLKAC
jgi:hypothetical protein